MLAMVNSEPGQYTVTTDAVIALKQAGVSDRIINAMVIRAGATTGGGGMHLAVAEPPFVLHDGMPVELRLSRNLSSADAKTGDTIDFEVLEEVTLDNLVDRPWS